MYGVIVRSTVQDVEESKKALMERLIPSFKQMPGFISGQWVAVGEHEGISMLTFESEEAARGAVDRSSTNVPPGVTIQSIEVGEVVARA
jgi:hypothetical protein